MKWDPLLNEWIEDDDPGSLGIKNKPMSTGKIALVIVGSIIAVGLVLIVLISIAQNIMNDRAAGIGTLQPSVVPSAEVPPTHIEDGHGLTVSALQGIAGAVGRAYFVEKDQEKASFIVGNAKFLAQPCSLYVSDGFKVSGDFKKASMRRLARATVKKTPGVTMGLIRTRGHWVGVVQKCETP